MSTYTYNISKNVTFLVKNNLTKNIRIFNQIIGPGLSRDLMKNPDISEEDIRHLY